MQITPRFVYSIISPECLHTVLRFSLSDFLISTNGDTSKMRCSRKVEDRVSNNNFECMPRINFPLFLYEVAVREIRWIDSPGTIRMGQQHRFERYYLRLKRKRALTFAGHYNFNNVCFICRRACRSNIFFFFHSFFFSSRDQIFKEEKIWNWKLLSKFYLMFIKYIISVNKSNKSR